MNRFAFFGTPDVARDTLALLVAAGYVPEFVVTSPDRPQGRGLSLQPCATKAWAEEQDLAVFAPEKLDADAVHTIASEGCDYAIVVAYGKILPQAVIDAFPKGVFNIHYSLLPQYRGASPVETALRNGDTVTGASIQRMVYKLDAGDVIGSIEEPIALTDTLRTLRPRLIARGTELLLSLLPAIEKGTAVGMPQDEAAATHTGKIRKEEGELDLAGDPLANWNTYRAFIESPGTYFFVDRNGTRMRVKIAEAHYDNGRFVIDRVVPEGKKEMSYADFSRA